MEGLTSVAWHGLENRRVEIGSGGSNPSPSAGVIKMINREHANRHDMVKVERRERAKQKAAEKRQRRALRRAKRTEQAQ